MWAYATLGMEPGAELAGAMSRRAVSTAGEFKPQDVANLMWAYATLGIEPVCSLQFDISSLSCVSIAHLSQLHQYFLCMDLEGLLLGALPPLPPLSPLPGRCRAAFEGAAVTTSGLERAVAGRLSGMGVGLTLDAREPRTGYSVDVRVEGAPPVALEVDGPWHFIRAAGQVRRAAIRVGCFSYAMLGRLAMGRDAGRVG